MKKIIFLLTIMTFCSVNAQFMNGGLQNQRQRQMMQTPERAPEPNFDVDQYLGIVVYDIEKTAKKSSVKLDSEEGKSFSKILTDYNSKIKQIRRINSFTLNSSKEMVENFQRAVIKNRDYSNQVEVQKKLAEDLKPISETMKTEDQKLDVEIKKILSEKQYQKWLKFNKSLNKTFSEENWESMIFPKQKNPKRFMYILAIISVLRSYFYLSALI